MEWTILALIAGVALICPTMMFGPMLLQRLGLRKAGTSSRSCMGMSPDEGPRAETVDKLRRRRAQLDREIEATAILADGAARRSLGSHERHRGGRVKRGGGG